MSETSPATDRLAHYWRLRQDILDGAFPRDVPLLETALSARYGTSRAPVREALTLLEHDGLIERALRGYRIRAGRPEDIVEIYQARIALEAEAAGVAALRHTDLDLARLSRQHDLCCAAPDDAAARAGNFRFHEALWNAAHNTTITALLERLTTRLRIYDSGPPASYGDPALLNAEHERIMAALRARDPETARAEMRAHLQRSLDQRITTFAENP
ncbi:GntR family transcriptional regulator [Actinocorallia sp. A-T 12471]|uniref:GntR family transcriptional regulator n=1 Tax=Actinocorallia sp. A-T 12471 TaxID=3089813 RepID=UPI0029CE13DA|nr:GntR family transcriptional regulator [Actinocorallia sp. A-T 12471]MDX6742291.1 GntR family transcriptional regulator [Actinocorallia sp. A-T 12471]